MVACDADPKSNNFREEPLVLVEVMSPATAGNDLREKLLAYPAIPTLIHYLIVNQSKMEVLHYQRHPLSATGWSDATLSAPGDTVLLLELGFSLTVAELHAESGIVAGGADSKTME